MGYDRTQVLQRTDLAELADQLLAIRKGRGPSATWPCPSPDHGEQTGRTPPVTIFTTRYGDQRWRCHACGDGGTAIDLVMRTQGLEFKAALEILGHRAGLDPSSPGTAVLKPALIHRPKPVKSNQAHPCVDAHVAACQEYLWSSRGEPFRRWLGARGLGRDILEANRVGADPGPAVLPRPAGLPGRGAGIVFPLLDELDEAIYLQTRLLRPGTAKYLNPAGHLVGDSPRIASVRTPAPIAPAGLDNTVVVCEGIPDALTAAQAGRTAVAVLGAGYPDRGVARWLVDRHPHRWLVVAFDSDERGRAGDRHLTELLAEHNGGTHVAHLDIPERYGDLNGWQQHRRETFGQEFSHAINEALGVHRNRTPGLTVATGPTCRNGPSPGPTL
jgi:DNA primase